MKPLFGTHYATGWWCGQCTSVLCTHSPWNPPSLTINWGPPIKQKKAWRWFDIFRTPPVDEIAPSLTLLGMLLWRRQERSDKIQRRRQKRRHFIQSLRTA